MIQEGDIENLRAKRKRLEEIEVAADLLRQRAKRVDCIETSFDASYDWGYRVVANIDKSSDDWPEAVGIVKKIGFFLVNETDSKLRFEYNAEQ